MPRYQAVIIVVTGLVIAAIASIVLFGGATGGRGIATIGGSFTLSDHTGKARSEQDLKGSYSLIYFGYMFCPDVCPTALQVMTNAMDRLDKNTQKRITPIFITIDPARDTAEKLSSYVNNFHPRMIGLTGTDEQIANVARAYRVFYAKSKDAGDTTEYLMDHSSIIFLMDPEGLYITHFSHATEPERMAQTLREKIGS